MITAGVSGVRRAASRSRSWSSTGGSSHAREPPSPPTGRRGRNPLAGADRVCRWWSGDPRLRPVLPGRRGQGRALRRVVLHRSAHHRHLLPAELPGPHAVPEERRVLPDRGRGAARRVPGVQAVPPRRVARLARVGPARRRRRPGDAAHRRRRRRPRRRLGARAPARVQRAAAAPLAGRRARRRPARPGPGPAGPDRARADRDHRPAHHRHRVRVGLRQHPPVQRHDPRGVRIDTERDARTRGSTAGEPGTITVRLAARAPFAGDAVLAFLAPRAVDGIERVDLGRRPTSARWRCRTGTACSPSTPRAGRGHRHVPARRPPRPHRGGGPDPPPVRSRRRPGRGRRRRCGGTHCCDHSSAATRASGYRAIRTASSCSSARSSGSRCRSRAPARSSAGS